MSVDSCRTEKKSAALEDKRIDLRFENLRIEAVEMEEVVDRQLPDGEEELHMIREVFCEPCVVEGLQMSIEDEPLKHIQGIEKEHIAERNLDCCFASKQVQNDDVGEFEKLTDSQLEMSDMLMYMMGMAQDILEPSQNNIQNQPSTWEVSSELVEVPLEMSSMTTSLLVDSLIFSVAG
jgi:hypothetical protein